MIAKRQLASPDPTNNSMKGAERQMNSRHSNILVLLVVLALCAYAQSLSGQEVRLSDEIRDVLAQNAAELSPITVSSTSQYRSSLPQEEVIEKLKMHVTSDYVFIEKPRRMIWQDGKIYCWRREFDPSNPNGQAYEDSFDGQILYGGSPDATFNGTSQPIFSKDSLSRLAKTKPNARYWNVAYFDQIGLNVPARVKDLHDNKSGSEVLLLLEGGARLSGFEKVDLDGREVTRIELTADNPEWRAAEKRDPVEVEKLLRLSFQPEHVIKQELETIRLARELPEHRAYVFYLDPMVNYAVRRREELYEDGTLLLQVNNKDFKQLKGRDVWLPRSSTADYYTWTTIPGTYFKSPVLSHVVEVSEFRLDRVPDEQFVLNYTKPGTIILDHTAPEGSLTYQIPADDLFLDAALESIELTSDTENAPISFQPSVERDIEQAEGKDPGPAIRIPDPLLSPNDRDWTLVIFLNALALVVLGTLGIWRYKHGSAASKM